MIKTYDEALKTLNDIRTYLAISRADDCVEELDKVARYFINEKHKENPTLEECIKEWEEEGYLCERTSRHFYIEEVNGNVIATFHILEKYIYTSMFINSKRLNLLTKTLKALEEKNECRN